MHSKSIIYKGFKLKSLDIKGHPVLGNNTFNFIDESDNLESLYFSVLIGPNGTGKSELFKFLLVLFKGIASEYNKPFSFVITYPFKLEYWFNERLITFTNIDIDYNLVERKRKRRQSNIFQDSELFFGDIDDIIPPNIIVNSFMLNDKFIFPAKNDSINYKYLGVRNSPQQASTRAYIRKIVEYIVKDGRPEVFEKGLKKLTNFLELPDHIEVSFRTINASIFFDGNLEKKTLDTFFKVIEDKYKDSPVRPPLKLDYYNKLKQEGERIKDLIAFVNELVRKDRLMNITNGRTKILKYRVDRVGEHKLIQKDYELLENLREIGLLKAPELNLAQKGTIEIQKTSSGEFHFFSTMIGLMATVVPNSLIFIDEPEISLHPNWQMKYLAFLRELFSESIYDSCQFVIATHSHFIISDLRGKSAKIIGLKKPNQELKTIDIKANTFGWSAEEVLYKIFDVRTTRNHYLEMDLRKLLGLVANNSENRYEIREILDRVKEVQLDIHDPLNLIINQVEEYLVR